MKYIKDAVKNSYYVLAFSVIGIFIGYLLRIFLSHTLSIEDFGLFYAVSAFIGLFTLVRYLGLNQALAKFIPEFLIRKENRKIKSSIIFVLIIQAITILAFTAFVFAFQDSLSSALFKSDKASAVLILMTLSFFPSMFFTVFQSVFQGYQKLKVYAVIEPARIALTFAFSIIFIQMGASGVALAYLVAATATTLIFLYSFYRLGITKAENDMSKGLLKKLLKFSIPVFVSSIGLIVITYTDTLVITFFRTLEEVALYQVALPTSQLLLVFSSAIAAVIFPLVSHLYSSRKLPEIERGIGVITFMLLFLLLPFVILLFSFPEIILGFLFGSEFLLAANTLRILSVGMIFYSLFVVFQTTLDGIGKPLVNTKIMFTMAAINFAFNLALVPVIGIMGSAAAFIISFLVGALLGFRFIKKYLDVRLSLHRFVKIFAGAIISTAAIYAMKTWFPTKEFFVILAVGWAVYLGIIIISRSVTKEDIEFIESYHEIPAIVKKATKTIFRQKRKGVVS